MDEPERDLSIGDILGLHLANTARGAAYRRERELDFVLEEATDEEFGRLAPRDQNLMLVLSYLPPVENSGIHEFMCRRVGDFAEQTLHALAAIGATSAHRALRQVCDLFPGQIPSRDQLAREEQISEIVKRLPSSDRPYLDEVVTCQIETNIHDLLMDYWNDHGDDPAQEVQSP